MKHDNILFENWGDREKVNLTSQPIEVKDLGYHGIPYPRGKIPLEKKL